MEKEKVIIITMEEYKELLMIKGKYEELKNQSLLKQSIDDCSIKSLNDRIII